MIGWIIVGIGVGVLLTPITVRLVLALHHRQLRRLDAYAGRDPNRETP